MAVINQTFCHITKWCFQKNQCYPFVWLLWKKETFDYVDMAPIVSFGYNNMTIGIGARKGDVHYFFVSRDFSEVHMETSNYTLHTGQK